MAAIVIKWLVHALKWRFSFARMFGSGGMPSAHSTFVIALSTAMGLKHGPWSDEFMICLVISIIIIYDAMNVRYQAGLHAKVLNRLTPDDGQTLNESMGHTPLEALVGWIIGFLTAVILLGL
jgi:acid phosphatase family membrane protein YuiD